MKTLVVLLLLFAGFFTSGFQQKSDCVEVERGDCFCTLQYDPVCGCNYKTYSNACDARCHGILDYRKGACRARPQN